MPCNRSSRSSKRVDWLVSHQTLGKMSPAEHGAISAEELLRWQYVDRRIGLEWQVLRNPSCSLTLIPALATQGSGYPRRS
jgi:hypothetical protein